jgi:hypothetical protein
VGDRGAVEWSAAEASVINPIGDGGELILLERPSSAIRWVYGTRVRSGTDDDGQQTDTHLKTSCDLDVRWRADVVRDGVLGSGEESVSDRSAGP